MWLTRALYCLYRPLKINNEEIRERSGTRTVDEQVKTRPWKWLAYVLRMPLDKNPKIDDQWPHSLLGEKGSMMIISFSLYCLSLYLWPDPLINTPFYTCLTISHLVQTNVKALWRAFVHCLTFGAHTYLYSPYKGVAQGGGGDPRKIGCGCASHFPKR